MSPDELGSADTYFLLTKVHLANYGGHAVVDRLHVTGRPGVGTRPSDVAGFLPSGGRISFILRFEWNNELTQQSSASVPIRARGQGLTEWRESLYFVNVRFVHGETGVGGWRAEIKQPLNVG